MECRNESQTGQTDRPLKPLELQASFACKARSVYGSLKSSVVVKAQTRSLKCSQPSDRGRLPMHSLIKFDLPCSCPFALTRVPWTRGPGTDFSTVRPAC